jgi:hypothetical protein
VPAAVGTVLIAAFLFFDITTNPHSMFRNVFFWRSEPVYKWVQSEDRTFSFLPGEGKAWGPFDPQQGEIHYDIRAYLPVDTGVMDQSRWGEKADAGSAMNKSATCYESRIVSAKKVCPIATGKPQLIFIRDIRAKQFTLGGFTGTFNRKKLEDQNSVTVTVFAWKCMENCK